MSATNSYIIPLHGATNPIELEALKVPECVRGQEPLLWFLPFTTPHCCGAPWNKQRGSQCPLCHQFFANKCKNHAGVIRKHFGASWQHCQRSGANMHPISITPTPRESIETPWRVSDL